MRLSHTFTATSALFDDPNLVSSAGLVPVLAVAESAGLRDLADEHLSVPSDKGANTGLMVSSPVGAMVAGADSIDRLNALLATLAVSFAGTRTGPVIISQRLRKGSTGSPRGAKRLVSDAVRTASRLLTQVGKNPLILVRMDSTFYGRGAVHAALAGGAAVSETVRMDKAVKGAIASIGDEA